MKIIETIFDKNYILTPTNRTDSRGTMDVFFSRREMSELFKGFEIVEQRMYRMPAKGTFFGLHYQNEGCARGKLISVVQGSGLDFIVDLRKNSPTYKRFKSFELRSDEPKVVFVAPGFGHGFLSLEDNTIQAFAIDVDYSKEHSGTASFRDPEIGIKLPFENVIISDYDRDAECY